MNGRGLLFNARARWSAKVVAGAAAIAAAAWIFSGELGGLLASAAVAGFDNCIATVLHAWAGAAVLRWMSLVSHLHGTAGILAMGALVAAWFLQSGPRRYLPVLAAAVPGGLLLNVAVKHAVHRARPDTLYTAEHLATFSFPSGHTAGATVLYGFLVALLWPQFRSRLARSGLVCIAAAMVGLVAASRVMLGEHYPSDCVGAVTEGLLWLAICLVGLRAGVDKGKAPTP